MIGRFSTNGCYRMISFSLYKHLTDQIAPLFSILCVTYPSILVWSPRKILINFYSFVVKISSHTLSLSKKPHPLSVSFYLSLTTSKDLRERERREHLLSPDFFEKKSLQNKQCPYYNYKVFNHNCPFKVKTT